MTSFNSLTFFHADITAVTTNTRPQRVFSSVWWTSINRYHHWWFFTCWPRADSFPVSRAFGRTCRRLSRFCNILLQDLAPLHVKITRNTNLLGVCRRKLKSSTYFFLNTRTQLVRVLASSGFYSIT